MPETDYNESFKALQMLGYRMQQSDHVTEKNCTVCGRLYNSFTFRSAIVGLAHDGGMKHSWNSTRESWHHSTSCTDCQQNSVTQVILRAGFGEASRDSAMRFLFDTVCNGSCDTQGETDETVWRQFFSHLDLALVIATAVANGDDPEPHLAVLMMEIMWNSGRSFDDEAVVILELMIEENIAEMKCNVDLSVFATNPSEPQPLNCESQQSDWATEVENRVYGMQQQQQAIEREHEERRLDEQRAYSFEVEAHLLRWTAARGPSMWAPRVS